MFCGVVVVEVEERVLRASERRVASTSESREAGKGSERRVEGEELRRELRSWVREERLLDFVSFTQRHRSKELTSLGW